MTAFSSTYIQINRTFHEQAVDSGGDDNTALGRHTLNSQGAAHCQLKTT